MHESAVDEYLAAIKVNPKYVEAHLNLGMAYTQLGMDARAIEEFKTVLEMEPNNQEAKLNLKVLGEAEGKGDSEHIISPDYADINARRGNDLMKAGKLDEAMAAFEEAIKQGARYADVLYNIGNIHEKKGQTEKALKYYRDALAINPLYALAKEAEKRIKGK
jgi:tetratricopeptide (TPR) repeat protein